MLRKEATQVQEWSPIICYKSSLRESDANKFWKNTSYGPIFIYKWLWLKRKNKELKSTNEAPLKQTRNNGRDSNIKIIKDSILGRMIDMSRDN